MKKINKINKNNRTNIFFLFVTHYSGIIIYDKEKDYIYNFSNLGKDKYLKLIR